MGLGAFVSRTARGVVADVLAILNSTSVFVWIVDLAHLVRAEQLGADLHHLHDHAAGGGLEPRRGRGLRRPPAARDGRRLPAHRPAEVHRDRHPLDPALPGGRHEGRLRPGPQGLGGRGDLRGHLGHRLRHELQPRDPGHPDGLRVGAGDDPDHGRHRQAPVRPGQPPPDPMAREARGARRREGLPDPGHRLRLVRGRGGRVRLPARAERLRQDHAAAHRRRHRAGQPGLGPARRPARRRRRRHQRHVGVVFQEDRLLPWLSLRDNVALVLRPLGLDAAGARGPRGRAT